jgi:uncharacterized protein with HEPN domain
MSRSQLAKIEFILEMMENIETVIKRHGSITVALDDEVEARAAILMFLMQIGETLKKLESSIIDKYELEDDMKGAYDVRNFIAHDYNGVNVIVIEDILRDNLPQLKTKVETIFKDLS